VRVHPVYTMNAEQRQVAIDLWTKPSDLSHKPTQLVVVVVVVMTRPSGAAYVGRQMSRRDEEFHQTLIVLEHICDVDRITKVMLAFCCPF